MDMVGFREQFPVLSEKVWLKTASVAPAAWPVLAALRAALDGWQHGDLELRDWDNEAQETRGRFARILGVEPRQIALTTSVALAAGEVAARLSRGRVVVGEAEYRSNLFPWLARADHDLAVTEVPMPGHVLRTDRVLEAIDDDTALVAVSDVQSASGSRVDLVAIGKRCREVGAELFVDATQSLGVLRFPLADAAPDYVAAHGYKWLVGPRGAAWFYVREPDPERVPIAPSGRSVHDPFAELYGGPLDLAPDARRLDASLAWPTWPGARAALELIESLDPAAVEARALALANRFAARLAELRLEPATSDLPSHIISAPVPDGDRVLERLSDAGVVATVRAGGIRAGFHAFNDESDVERTAQALAEAL